MARYEVVAAFWKEPVGPPDNFVRHNRGAVIDVSDEQADRLLQLGAIEPVDVEADSDLVEGESDEAKAAALSEWLTAEAAWQASIDTESQQNSGDSGPGSGSSEPPQTPATGNLERPKQAASKAVWVEYAVSRGFDPSRAEELDKRELIAALE